MLIMVLETTSALKSSLYHNIEDHCCNTEKWNIHHHSYLNHRRPCQLLPRSTTPLLQDIISSKAAAHISTPLRYPGKEEAGFNVFISNSHHDIKTWTLQSNTAFYNGNAQLTVVQMEQLLDLKPV